MLLRYFSYFNDPTPAPTPTPTPATSTFTQEQVNNMIAAEKRKVTAEKETMAAQLEELRKTSSLTAAEKDSLQAKIDELLNATLTKEQLAAKEQDKLKKKYESDLEATKSNEKKWQDRYTKSTIDNTILQAVSSVAYSPTQMLEFLAPKAKLIEKLDEQNKPTGEFEVKVNVRVKDAKGKLVPLELTLEEALTQMKDCPDEYGNLFKGNLQPGVGTNNGTSGGKLTVEQIKRLSPAEYRKHRDSIIS